MISIKSITSVVICVLSVSHVWGQNLNNFALSNNSGIYAVLVNPALGVESVNQLSINAIGGGINSESNSIRLIFNDPLGQNLALKFYRKDYKLIEKPYAEYIGEKSPNIFVNAQLLLPSVLWNINQSFSVYAYIRERAYGSLHVAGSDMASLLLNYRLVEKDIPRDFAFDRRDLQYNEMALGFSAVLLKKRQNFLSIGYTFKKLSARSFNFMRTNNFESQQYNDMVSVNLNYQVISTRIENLSKNMTSFLLFQNAPGRGFGSDIGIVYEKRPYSLRNTYSVNNPRGRNKSLQQREKTKYSYRAHMALNDIGRIHFKGDSIIFNRLYQSTANIQIDSAIGTKDAIQFFNQRSIIQSETHDIKVFTSATLNAGIDFRLADGLYVHTLLTKGLHNKKNPYTPIVPLSISGLFRKEWHKFMVGMPYRVVPVSQTYTLGILFSTGPFFLGTDNLSTLFSNRVRNFSAYGGLVFNIRYLKSRGMNQCATF